MTDSKPYDIAIIGAGVSGLAAAIRLKKRYDKVVILEKNKRSGGKLDTLQWGDYRWDKGPSLFTEPELVDELFELWKKKASDYYQYFKLDTYCSYFFPDTSEITLSRNSEKTKASISAAAGNASVQEFENYRSKSKKLFNSVGDYFISNPKPGIRNLVSKSMLQRYPQLVKKEVRKSLNRLNEDRFTDKRLVQIFNRYGTYNGSNPYQMSGLYSTIAHVELNKGAYFPMKGMRSIVDALTKLAVEVGVEIRYNSRITITKAAEKDFQINGSVSLGAKKVVCAIDHLNFYRNVMPSASKKQTDPKSERSTSGLIFYWAVDKKIDQLGVHNILFSKDYEGEFNALFQERKLPEDPTYYIHISSTVNKNDAPKNGQNWFVMINTPAGVIPTLDYRNRIKKLLFKRIKAQFNKDIEHNILFEDFWDCHSIQSQSGSYLGALYGPSSNTLTASIKRHGNVSKEVDNLYFCGGTVHPGGGIPLVLRSAKIVDDLIK